MDPQMQSTVVGGLIAASAGIVAWGLGTVSSYLLSRQQREHERQERRYDDLKSAAVAFSSELRRVVLKAEKDAFDNMRTYAEEEPGPGPIDHLQDDAEEALEELRLFADEDLYLAGRAWLDAYYARFWKTEHESQGHSADTGSAQKRFIDASRQSLGVVP